MKKTNELKQGLLVFAGLAVLTAVEYVVAITHLPAILLWVLALVKAGLVLWFFMHIKRVFNDEGGH